MLDIGFFIFSLYLDANKKEYNPIPQIIHNIHSNMVEQLQMVLFRPHHSSQRFQHFVENAVEWVDNK